MQHYDDEVYLDEWLECEVQTRSDRIQYLKSKIAELQRELRDLQRAPTAT